jgi:preprotein translocase subunit YajC
LLNSDANSTAVVNWPVSRDCSPVPFAGSDRYPFKPIYNTASIRKEDDAMTGIAYAMGSNPAQQGGGSGLEGIFMLVAMFAIFYFLLIRPQQKRAKQHREMIQALKSGDQVVTAGGIHGRVVTVQDSVVTLEISNGVRVKVNRVSIAGLSSDQE